MKKISAIVLALLLVVAAFATFGASAADEKAIFSVETKEEGGNLVVTWYVQFANGADIKNGGFDIVWSSDLEVVTAPKAVSAKNGGLGATVGNPDGSKVKISFASVDPFDADTYAIATATFKKSEGGTTYIDLTKVEGGATGSEADYSKVSGAVAGPLSSDAAVKVEVAAVTTTPAPTTVTEAPTTTTTAATTVATTTAATTKAPGTGATGAAAPIALISLIALAGAGIVAVSLKKHK